MFLACLYCSARRSLALHSTNMYAPHPCRSLSLQLSLNACVSSAFAVAFCLLPVVNKMNFAFGNPSNNLNLKHRELPTLTHTHAVTRITLATLMNTTLFFMSCQTLFSIHFVVCCCCCSSPVLVSSFLLPFYLSPLCVRVCVCPGYCYYLYYF